MPNRKRKRKAAPPPPPLPSPPVVPIFCWVEDDKSSFNVKIALNETIADLKREILKEKRSLSSLDVDQIQLFEANIRDTIPKTKFDFNPKKELLASRKLSSVFGGETLKEEHIHIAIKKPSKLHSFLLSKFANSERPTQRTYKSPNVG